MVIKSSLYLPLFRLMLLGKIPTVYLEQVLYIEYSF
jgi:hypothetical protein